jgi:hypothetical protein
VFKGCTSLTAVFFQGNPPTILYQNDPPAWEFGNATVYYLPGTTGWGSTFPGVPTALWQPQVQTADSSFGVRTNQFGFDINWASGMTVVVEASPTLIDPTWSPLSTNTLTTGSSYFADPQWTNYPTRFYRLRMP